MVANSSSSNSNSRKASSKNFRGDVIADVAAADSNGQGQGRRKLSTYTLTFSYTGSVQQWVMPAYVASFTVDAYGAAGGDIFANTQNYYSLPCGLGGYNRVERPSSFSLTVHGCAFE